MRRLVGLVGAGCLLSAWTFFDLDVAIPTGTPFESIKIPTDSPTATTETGDKKPAREYKPGETVAEDPKKVPPPKPPSGLPGISRPSTIDYQQHLKWTPKDEIVDYKDPKAPATPTGGRDGAVAVDVWNVDAYPPKVPNDLYEYAATRFLMVMLHPQMVSEREQTQFLLDLDYAAYYAATACKHESRLTRMTDYVMQAVGPMAKQPPAKPASVIEQRVTMDLLSSYPYEASFGAWIMSQPSEQTLPVLLNIIKTQKHPFLVRNAVFILRCYNTPEVLPPLRALLTSTQDKVIRNRALAALARWRDPEIVPWLCGALKGPDVSFRSYAVWALGRIGGAQAADAVSAAAGANANDGDFLWAAIPAMAWIGETSAQDKRDKLIRTLQTLDKIIPTLKGPTPWDGTGGMATKEPDPDKVFNKILDQRARFARAMCGRAAEIELVKRMTESDVIVSNRDFYREVVKKLP